MYSLEYEWNRRFGYGHFTESRVFVVGGSCLGKSEFLKRNTQELVTTKGLRCYHISTGVFNGQAYFFIDMDLPEFRHADNWYTGEISDVIARMEIDTLDNDVLESYHRFKLVPVFLGHTFPRHIEPVDFLIAYVSNEWDLRKKRWVERGSSHALDDDLLDSMKSWQERRYMLPDLVKRFGCNGEVIDLGRKYISDSIVGDLAKLESSLVIKNK